MQQMWYHGVPTGPSNMLEYNFDQKIYATVKL